MRNESGPSMRGLAVLAMLAFVVTASSIYLGSAKLSHMMVELSLVCISCYIIYEYLILKLLYFQIYRRRIRVATDSPDLRKQVWSDIALYERRVCMVPFILMFILAGSLFKGFIGSGIALLLAVAIIMYARKSRII
jgi:hypothetical protein